MNPSYLSSLEDLLKQVLPTDVKHKRFEFKNCFGAVACYVDGNIFVSYGKFGLALKLPPRSLAALSREADVLPLRYFKNGHVKREYAVIPERILNDRRRFRELLNKSIKFASLNPKRT